MSLAGKNSDNESHLNVNDQDMNSDKTTTASSCGSKDYLSESNLLAMSNFSIDDVSEDIDENDRKLLMKDRSACTTQELESIRRERNRIHAKKTRLRKKRMLQQLENTISALDDEVSRLRKLNKIPQELSDIGTSESERSYSSNDVLSTYRLSNNNPAQSLQSHAQLQSHIQAQQRSELKYSNNCQNNSVLFPNNQSNHFLPSSTASSVKSYDEMSDFSNPIDKLSQFQNVY